MMNQYASDDFVVTWNNLKSGDTHLDYSLNEGYLLMGNHTYVITSLRQNLMMESHAHLMLDTVVRQLPCLYSRGISISLLSETISMTLRKNISLIRKSI